MTPTSDPSDSSPSSKKLEQILTEKAGTLSPEDSVETAGERMRSLETDTWPVAEGRKLVGMINEANPDLKAAGAGHDPKTTKVSEGMNRQPIYCFEDQTKAEAEALMDKHGLRYLPVVDRELRIVGIIRRDELSQLDGPGAHGSAPEEISPVPNL